MKIAPLAAVAASAVLVLSGCATTHSASSDSGGEHGASHSAPVAAGDPDDVAFAQMMIPHHEQAVEMSKIALGKDGISEEVLSLARQIQGAQDPEIQQMRSWLTKWGASADVHAGHEMDGMLTDEQMAALRAAEGEEFERLWMEGMILHHEGAIDMANDVLANGEDVDVKSLANAIVAAQTSEIEEMEALLKANR